MNYIGTSIRRNVRSGWLEPNSIAKRLPKENINEYTKELLHGNKKVFRIEEVGYGYIHCFHYD